MMNFVKISIFVALASAPLRAQDAGAPAAKPTEHVLGTIVSVDTANQTITVKDDKTSIESTISVGTTKTIFRVEPGAKDLSKAVRIPASDLQTGDRVDVRGFKAAGASAAVEARSVVLMSATALEQKRTADLEAWQNATVGTLAGSDPTAGTLMLNARSGQGPKQIFVHTSADTEWTRYSAATPKNPAKSQMSELQTGDQLHIIGTAGSDGSVTAQKIYSAPLRTIAGTVVSIAADAHQVTVRNLQTKQPVTVSLNDGSSLRKLPPMMAAMLARRLNPNYRPDATQANGAQQPGGQQAGQQHWGGQNGGGPGSGSGGGYGGSGAAGGAGRGDMSRMIEHVPAISLNDLKPGDAVVIWGLAGSDASTLTANTVLAGVEPVLQSAPPRQGQSLGGDWGLDVAVPAQ